MGHFLAGISAATVKKRISQTEKSSSLISRTGCTPRERRLICLKFLHIALLDTKESENLEASLCLPQIFRPKQTVRHIRITITHNYTAPTKKLLHFPTKTTNIYQEKDPWISASQALFDCKVCINFDLGVPARAAWSALSAEGLGIAGLPLVALLPFGCKGVLGGRAGGGVAVVMMTPFVIWAGGSGSISGRIGRLLGTGGNGEGCDELGAVFSVLPEGELLELDFCSLIVK